MNTPEALRPKPWPAAAILVEATVPCPEFNRFLYTAVGWPFYWIDKLSWSYDQWRTYVERPVLRTWVAYWEGTPAGYFELERQDDGSIRLAYFGLLPQFVGKQFGGALLTAAIQQAWQWGTTRIWVDTCSLDHAAALGNYLARGFHIEREVHGEKQLPPAPQRDWPQG